MNALNTGLSLRKPYESSYAAFRRFLIANAHLSYGEITHRLSNATRGCDIRNVFTRAAWCEYRYCRRHQIPVVDTDNMSRTRGPDCVRNCQRCAELGYHTSMFDCRWLDTCPIHWEPFRTTCAQCANPWPRWSDLHLRRCTSCGTHIDIAMLIDRQAFENPMAFEGFSLFEQMSAEAQSLSKLVLTPGIGLPDVEGYERHPLLEFHADFPSFYCVKNTLGVRDQQWLAPFLRPVRTLADRAEEVDACATRRTDYLSAERWEKTLRMQVMVKILRAIAKAAGAAHKPCLITEGFAADSRADCCYCIALSIWRGCVLGVDLRPFHHFLGSVYGEWDFERPLCPKPLRYLQIIESTRLRCFKVPQSIQQFIYCVDLWTTFCNILRYINYLYAADTADTASIALFKAQPEAQPKHSLSDALGFFINDQNILTIVIPEAVLEDKLPILTAVGKREFEPAPGIYFTQKSPCTFSVSP